MTSRAQRYYEEWCDLAGRIANWDSLDALTKTAWERVTFAAYREGYADGHAEALEDVALEDLAPGRKAD